MGSCLGDLAKLRSQSDRRLETLPKPKRNISSAGERGSQWFSCRERMETKSSNSCPVEKQSSPGPSTGNEEINLPDQITNNTFINHAAIAWHEKRRGWIGDQSKRHRRVAREPIISWCTTYDDLLSSNQPFGQPIALAEMVDFLVDIWHEEGLYD